MKNLKRALSFAVAAVMLVGMMAIGTSAFTDDADIVNTEAVNIMNQLNIIAGKPDGSFDPKAPVSRAEMAKMICVALNGGKDPILDTDVTSYTDTVGNWAAGYIEYCSNLGIISGYNGLFRPADTVTGSEAAKMLLVAIGYNAQNEGFVGADWSMNVNIVANQKNLYKDLTILPGKTLTRDEAAQMIYNAMTADIVTYDYKLNSVDGNLTTVAVAINDVNATTILRDKFGMGWFTAVVTDATYSEDDEEYTYKLGNTANNNTALQTLPVSVTSTKDFSGLFMQAVKVLVDADGDCFGIYAKGGKVLAECTVADLDIATNAGKLTVNKVKYDYQASNIPVYAMLEDAACAALDNLTGLDEAFAAKVIDKDGDKDADVIVVVPYTVEEVTYVGEKSVVAGANYKYEDKHNIYTGIAKGDYAVVVSGTYTVNNDVDTLTKAEVVTGEITAADGNKVLVGGTWYTKATNGDLTLAKADLGDTYDLVVVNGYYYAGEETDTEFSAADIVYVAAADAAGTGMSAGTQKVKVIFYDGTSAVVTVDKIDAVKVSTTVCVVNDTQTGTVFAQGLYTYKTDKDGNYELTTVYSTDYDVADTTFNKIDDSKTNNAYRFNADAVIWVVDTDGEVEVVAGKDVATWDNATVSGYVYGEKKDGFAYAQVGVVYLPGTTMPGVATNTGYGMIVGDAVNKVIDTKNYVELTIWNGTENITVVYETADDATSASYDKGKLISYEVVDAGEIEAVASVGTSGKVEAYNGTEIMFEGVTSEYTITEDTKIIYVDTDAVEGVAGGSIAIAKTVYDELSGDVTVANVYWMSNDATVNDNGTWDLTVLFVDINNEWV